MRTSTAWRWMRAAPAERMTLPATGVLWGAAEIMHAAHVGAIDIGVTAALAAGVTYGVSHRLGYRKKHGDDAADQRADSGRKAAAALAAMGGWMALAARYGVLAGPYGALSDVYTLAALLGYRKLRRHDPVARAREWRAAKRDWLGRGATYGLNGTHLLDYERTRIGERFEVDTRDTGRRASHHATSGLAERIAEIHQLPRSRVRVTEGRIAGRIEISIRHRDPWAEVVPHPVLDDDPDFDLPVPCTVKEPVVIGYEPETWQPITLSLWEPAIGGKNILLTGMKGAGKTVLLNCLRERVTAAEDAILVDINLSKALEDLEWSPACDMTGIGDGEREKARAILDVIYRAILWRPAQGRETAKHVPDRKHPLVVLVIDEIDKAVASDKPLAHAIKTLLTDIMSSGRSEGVAVVLAGQRGTVQWIGGPNVKANIDTFCVGKVNKQNEARHGGAELGVPLPAMTAYGEGHGGVWGITTTDSDEVQLGRTFALIEPLEIREVAYDRRGDQPSLERGLVAHLGESYQALRTPRGEDAGRPSPEDTQPVPHGGGERTATAVMERTEVEDLEGYEAELDLPADVRDRFAALDARLAGTRQGLADLDGVRLPKVSPGTEQAAAKERWDGLVRDTVISPADRERVIAAIRAAGPEGISRRQLAADLGMDRQRNALGVWVKKLISEGSVIGAGEKRGARLFDPEFRPPGPGS